MSSELSPDLQLEIAHLLLIDIVGYSKLLTNEQIDLLNELNQAVRCSECFQTAEKNERLIKLPTGDGMALLFFRSPEEPVRCALEITKALKELPHLRVRMAAHSGPVNRIVDVNDMLNVAGAGINIAQRLLDCADAGHVLLSKHMADDLAEYRHWQPYLKDLGECEVKHGLRLHVVNLCKDDLGNPQLPEKLKPRKMWERSSSGVRPIKKSRWPKWAPAAALLLSVCALAFSFAIFFHRSRSADGGLEEVVIPEKSIAVLPFANLSDDKRNAFFADGVQDEILTNLTKVADLKVISRTSVMQYKTDAQRNLREIGKTLGVAHVLEGTVQRSGERVRVSAQLIDARTDTQLWAERYDRELADVFAIENELAEKIVSALKSQLSPNEKAAIEEKPTADLAAHDLFVRAKILIDKAVFNEPRGKYLSEAVKLLDKAVGRDPSFVAAFYQLAHAHDQLYVAEIDHTPARLAMADAAIGAIRRLAPESGEAHLALAKHLYWGYLDYDHAREQLKLARRTLPNEPMSYLLEGYIDRRQGRWDESLKNMRRARELDPQNALVLRQIALTYSNLRRYPEMAATLDQALKFAPNDASIRVQRATIDLDWHADPKPLHSTLQTIFDSDPNAIAAFGEIRFSLALYERDLPGATQALATMAPDILYGGEGVSFPRSWCEALVARLRGDNAAAQAAFAAAREQVEKGMRVTGENASALCALGMIDAGLGKTREAVHESRRAVQLLPTSKDSIDGVAMLEYLAVVYAWTGKKDAAFDELASLIKLPGYLSYGQLRLDPKWDPLRDDPRFDKIVASLAPK